MTEEHTHVWCWICWWQNRLFATWSSLYSHKNGVVAWKIGKWNDFCFLLIAPWAILQWWYRRSSENMRSCQCQTMGSRFQVTEIFPPYFHWLYIPGCTCTPGSLFMHTFKICDPYLTVIVLFIDNFSCCCWPAWRSAFYWSKTRICMCSVNFCR